MPDLIVSAIPVFVVLMALEVWALRHAAHEHAQDADAPVGYDLRDSRTSIAMGLGHLGITLVTKLGAVALYAAVYELSPIRIPNEAWWAWLLLVVGDDLSFYAYHRSHHRVRVLWATHVVHHSSQHFNLSTALRQDWSPITQPFFWVWLAVLGFEPWQILLAQSWSLLYQFLLHTEKVRTLPRPVELVMNTPSHHRVHHGSQAAYLDTNYAGIFIVWDRLFGTFQAEGERVRYGLTTNITTYNPVRVAYHEWHAMLRDVRHATRWRDRAGYLLRGPGWRPAGEDALASAGASDAAVGRPEAPAVAAREAAPAAPPL